MNDIMKQIDDGFANLGHYDHSMDRNRPYDGQPWTDGGNRGKQEVSGVTMRDIRRSRAHGVSFRLGIHGSQRVWMRDLLLLK